MQYTVILLIYFFLFYWHNLLFKNTEIIYNSETYCISFTLYLDIYISFIVENNHYLISAFQESTFQRRITQSFLIEYFLYTYQHINSDIQCINKNKSLEYMVQTALSHIIEKMWKAHFSLRLSMVLPETWAH